MQVRAYTLVFGFVISFCPQMDMSVLEELWRLIDLTEPRFCVAVIAIIFNPFFWNVVSHCICISSALKDDQVVFMKPSMICVFLVSSRNSVTWAAHSCITFINITPISAVLLQSQFEKHLQTIENAECSCWLLLFETEKHRPGLQSCSIMII